MNFQEHSGELEAGSALTRRNFIKASLAAGAVIGAARGLSAANRTLEIPQRPLGKTGLKVSILGLGGYHIGSVWEEAEAIHLMRHAVDQGITFMDNCWDYHNGKSEDGWAKLCAMAIGKESCS